MRIAVAVVLGVVLGVCAARADTVADERALKAFAGKLVVSPDAPPSTLGELAEYLKINVAKDSRYELIKGPPWTFHLVSWFAKPTAGAVTLVIVDKADKKATPMLAVASPGFAGTRSTPKGSAKSIDATLSVKRRLLYAHVEANASTGFEVGKPYVVRMMQGKKLVAKCDLLLRE